MKSSLVLSLLSVGSHSVCASLSSGTLTTLRGRGVKTTQSTAEAQHRFLGQGQGQGHGSSLFEVPTQTFYIPLPEASLLENAFQEIIPFASGDIHSIIAISVNSDDTIIWYDHYEDGFEDDVLLPMQSSTQVWGDGDNETGCLPWIDPCTSEADILVAGQSIILENPVNVGNPTGIYFGGSDKIQTNFPIAVTRGAYPDYPGSALAGAVEVFDTHFWGTNYDAAIASDADKEDYWFQYVGANIMAASDNTIVNFPNGTVAVLNEGESAFAYLPEIGQEFFADKPVQVHLLTGDALSVYELRWFSLRPTSAWSQEYWSPVGMNEADGGCKLVLYNPNSFDLTITYEDLRRGKKGNNRFRTKTVPSKQLSFSRNIPTGSGARVFADHPFAAFAIIHTKEEPDKDYDGQIYDWGFPLVPVEFMTPTVLVGWGYGCEDLDCNQDLNLTQGQSRSVVWVTPKEDAEVYVDYDNDGNWDKMKDNFWRLQSKIFKQERDDDMSGSVIWATKLGTGPNGPPVLITAAWGQDPRASNNTDTRALDLGTAIPPFSGIWAVNLIELLFDNLSDVNGPFAHVISLGDTLRFVILVKNVGVHDLPLGSFVVTDELDENLEYVANSTEYWSPGTTGTEKVDDLPGGGFPLSAGVSNRAELTKRGAYHIIEFSARIKEADEMTNGVPSEIQNTGVASYAGYMSSSFGQTVALPAGQR